jgi:hypothetical protein
MADGHLVPINARRFRRKYVLWYYFSFICATVAICIVCDKLIEVETTKQKVAYVRTREAPRRKEIEPTYSHVRHRARPTPNELLPASIHLRCSGLTVVEWRPTFRWRHLTSPRPESIAVIDDLCVKAFETYPEYVYDRFGWTRETGSSVGEVYVSLLPANELVEGRSSRALNDFSSRFKGLQTCCNWGMYVSSLSSLFIRNDPLLERGGKPIPSRYFAKIFLHEMAHIMNDKYGYIHNYFPGDKKRDEQLAEDFAGSMGYNFAAEDPSEDIANKE